jgi:hypothetical protein
MIGLLRIFKYARRRIIALSMENLVLKQKLMVQEIKLKELTEINDWNKSLH